MVCNNCSVTENEDYITQKYIYGKILGKGHSCKVLVCINKKTNLKYAVKIMPDRIPSNKNLFEREQKILSLLKHPNIMTLHESYNDSMNYYIISELCEGGELFDRIMDESNPMTEKRVSALVKTMLLALQHCHERNVVHRDIKPENFVFKTEEKNSQLVLIDFGCGQKVEDDLEYRDLVGTPYYLAPESAAGDKYIRTGAVLKSSDIWAVGVIAYVMLTGRPPFDGESNAEIFQRILTNPVKFPPTVKISKLFIDFCLHILKKSPKRRIKLEEALAHPWVQGKSTSTVKISADVMRVLRQFNRQSKLKKAITRMLAENMGEVPEKKIREQFFKLDKNNDGGIDISELTVLLTNMGFTKSRAEEEAKKIMATSDVDGSGLIEFVEFAQIWQRKLLCVNESYIQAIFTVLDEDGDGNIDADELSKVLSMNKERDGREIRAIISEVDTDCNGVLSYEEFRAAMMEQDQLHKGGLHHGHKFNASEVLGLDIENIDLDNADL